MSSTQIMPPTPPPSPGGSSFRQPAVWLAAGAFLLALTALIVAVAGEGDGRGHHRRAQGLCDRSRPLGPADPVSHRQGSGLAGHQRLGARLPGHLPGRLRQGE
ncbi:hypothetical protein [Streptomyces sp. NRRL WC-3618]|uniref:hypothetical protein n=1 Tax=Streptomyces sp. NRRL WC-3618 TaxID=1519490 RepID=UPI0006AE2B98|nr:hypothetical protein [Streptomyces sp. NRRL WC-3618]